MLNTRLEKLGTDHLTKNDLLYLMSLTDNDDLHLLYEKAYAVKEKYIGRKAYYRGLIEFSNRCVKDCYYCGIRRSNADVERYDIAREEILQMAEWAYRNRYGSVTLQSGERSDPDFCAWVTELVRDIKAMSSGQLGITLCLGEQARETYAEWFDAGAHRYLLRIETSSPALYQKLHPGDRLHSFDNRVSCLTTLKELGYQVGTGVMIGLPGQSDEDLVEDILFFEKMDIGMIGMGPYVVHKDTPLGAEAIAAGLDTAEERQRRFTLGLKMIAVARIYLKDINIAATTALQALHPQGREMGLKAGANILMPIITLPGYREKYRLYDGKPCMEDNAEQCKACLTRRVQSAGDAVGFGEWGDSPHYKAQRRCNVE